MLRRGEHSSNATLTASAEELVRQLHNNPDIIPPYDKELLEKCSKQISEMYEENLNTLYVPPCRKNIDILSEAPGIG